MNVPILEKALVQIVLNPPTGLGDANRDAAAAAMAALDYGAWVGSIPQGTTNALGIVIERAGGVVRANLDTPQRRAESIVDFTYWAKDVHSNRERVEDLLRLMEYVRITLEGIRYDMGNGGSIDGVVLESEPFAQDERPGDGTDGWYSRLTESYAIQWHRASASHVVSPI